MPAMNDVKIEKQGKREVNDILYKKNGHLTKDRDGISIFKEPGFQRPELSKQIKRRLEVIRESDSQYSAPRLEPHFGHWLHNVTVSNRSFITLVVPSLNPQPCSLAIANW